MKTAAKIICLGICCLALMFNQSVTAAPACGVTIITHGFETGTFPNWPRQMAQAITNRIGAVVPIYRVKYNFDPILLTGYVSLEDGAADIDITQSGGAIILLDWSDVSWDFPVTAQSVADSFFAYLFGQTHTGHSLVEVPVHLIGHSRGCSLNAELAYELAFNGVIVDQVTTLDPHPVTDQPFPDLIPQTYINVIFADNYWQTHLDSFPNGMEISGAFNWDLSSVFGVNSINVAGPHEEVHAYYHGTIDLSATDDGDGTSIEQLWYDNTFPRYFVGYNYSRYLNVSRPSAGVNQFISNAGGQGSRISVDSPQQVWSFAGFDQRNVVPSVVTVGQTINIPFWFADRNSQQTITFYTDSDSNPYNGEQSQIGSMTESSRPAGSIGADVFSWTPTVADIGTHYIRVKGANVNGYARYDYLFKPITVQAALAPITPTITTLSPSTLLTSATPQTIKIIGTGFLSSSTLLLNGSAPPGSATFTVVTPNEIDYHDTFQTTRTWSVQVVNSGQTSNSKNFTINPQQLSTGSLVINLSPPNIGDQWQVNGTYYNSGDVAYPLTPGQYTVSFKPIFGYTTPSSQTVTINANAQTTTNATYAVIAPSTYSLTLNQAGSMGSIVNQPFGSGSGNIYTAGALIQVTANANFGYHFVNWSGDVSGTANPTTLTINGNKSVTANFAAGDPNLGTIVVTIQPPEAAAAGVTWGLNDSDFRASGSSYSYYPETVFVELHNTNGWVGAGGSITFTAGQTSNYTFTASSTSGSTVGTDPRTYFTLAGSAGNPGSTNGTGTSAQFNGSWSVAVDSSNNVFVADTGNNTIRKITAAGVVTTFAGQAGNPGFADNVGTNAQFSKPIGVAIDKSNNLYVADYNNSVIRKITPSGSVSTLAGIVGNPGSTDTTDGTPRFHGPVGVAVDTNGNVYVADSINDTIRKITAAGVVSTLAGMAGAFGSTDDTGSAARFDFPSGVAVDKNGNVYVADSINSTIRKITPGGAVSTPAGFAGSAGVADGTGNSARFSFPNGVAVDGVGNVYVADSNNQIIREMTPAGVVTTLAGLSGNKGTNDGVGNIVRFNSPDGIAVDNAGNIIVADTGNQTIRATQPLTTTVDQTISFAPLPNKSAGDLPFALTATASSGLPVYFAILSGPALLNSNVVTLVGSGTVTTIAWQPGNSNYNAAVPVQQSFNVSPIPQTITFGALSQQKQGDAPFPLNATADSGLPVNFSIVSGPATLNGNILVLNGWGTVTVNASQPGNNSYTAAASVTQSFFVAPPDNTIVSPQRLLDGSFQLAFYGLMSSNYTIQTSTNLINWQTFTNFTGSDSVFYLNDSAATNFKQRFYRVTP